MTRTRAAAPWALAHLCGLALGACTTEGAPAASQGVRPAAPRTQAASHEAAREGAAVVSTAAATTSADRPGEPATGGTAAPTQARSDGSTPPAPDILGGQTFVGTDQALEDLVAVLADSPLSSLKPVGSTSTVFQTHLAGPTKAAFKARTKKRPRGPAAEVAAFRMARLLGLTNVPPAVSRSVPLAQLRAQLRPDAAAEWPEIEGRLQVRGGQVEGAAIHWVEGLTHLGVDLPAGVARWTEWLSLDGAIPENERSLAASVSTMLVFDYLIGNWDRWSGGNAKGDADGRYLYFRDHDAAFPVRLQPRMHRRMVDRLLKAERFSRRLYQRLNALTREAFEAEIARDPGGVNLLSPRQIANVFDRRRTILSHVGALIEEHGSERVLVFP